MTSSLETLCSSLTPPTDSTRIWKHECPYSFQDATSPDGVFINLLTFQAVSRRFLEHDNSRSGNVLYLHHRRTKTPKPTSDAEAEADQSKVTKLAIGVEGGFQVDESAKFDFADHYDIVIFPDVDQVAASYPSSSLPSVLLCTVESLIKYDDMSTKKQVETWSQENEPRLVSKYAADLPQLDNGVKISSDPASWVCAESGMRENLWLNLSTGHIGSGRRNWDGSGGTGAAEKHYEDTGRKYPLVVKLGTISAKGSADVYSYAPDENDMVNDPSLEQHLRHWGINMADLTKTEKTIAEMEVDMNVKYDWSKITEGDEQLTLMNGPGLVGLENLGNSCYMNSVFQVLLSIPEFQARYGYGRPTAELVDKFFRRAPSEPQADINTQMVKLASGMSDPDWQCKRDQDEGAAEGQFNMYVKPSMLKHALGANHIDFAGNEQQDAAEYLQHMLEKLKRADASNGPPEDRDCGQWMRFLVEERLECMQSNQVKYSQTGGNTILSLRVPIEACTNAAEVEAYTKEQQEKDANNGDDSPLKKPKTDPVRPIIPFEACLSHSLGASAAVSLADYRSPVTGEKGVALKTTRLASFPKYLVVRLERYVVENWQPKKLECHVPVPDSFDMTAYRGEGLKPGETEMQASADGATTGQLTPDDNIVAQLMGMGFNENGCKRAAVATKNVSVEAAMEWVLTNMSDPDFEKPLESNNAGVTSGVDANAVAMLTGMGFPEESSTFALEECKGNVEAAANWLFTHTAEDIAQLISARAADRANADSSGGSGSEVVNDAKTGKYNLRGFISHVGKSVHGGHYLCHIKKDGQWVLFNDRKVAASKNPPKDLGYLYLFEREG